MLNALMGDKDAQVETTKVRNHEELCRTLKFLENDSSSKKKGTSIENESQHFFCKNDEARIDRINIVKKSMADKKKALEEKACLDSNYQGEVHDPQNVAKSFEEDSEFKHGNNQKHILDAVEKNKIWRADVALC